LTLKVGRSWAYTQTPAAKNVVKRQAVPIFQRACTRPPLLSKSVKQEFHTSLQ
jgi:hypothetical protein